MAARRTRRTPAPRVPRSRSPVEVVRAYIRRINAGDSQGLGRLGGANLRFVDATGGVHALTAEAWAAYFEEFPDYRIRIEKIFSDGRSVAVFGVASGSYRGRGAKSPGAAWRFPAAWHATVRGGKLLEWRVYGDIEPMLRSAGHGRS